MFVVVWNFRLSNTQLNVFLELCMIPKRVEVFTWVTYPNSCNIWFKPERIRKIYNFWSLTGYCKTCDSKILLLKSKMCKQYPLISSFLANHPSGVVVGFGVVIAVSIGVVDKLTCKLWPFPKMWFQLNSNWNSNWNLNLNLGSNLNLNSTRTGTGTQTHITSKFQ